MKVSGSEPVCIEILKSQRMVEIYCRRISFDNLEIGIAGALFHTLLQNSRADGLLLCSAYPTLTPYTGAMPGIKAFVAAVFGGIGSIPGAMVGGILLGVIEIFGKAYISSQVADAICFAVLIVVLLVKPTGLFGKNIQEKV